MQASLNQKQRLQQLFFPDGIAFDGKRLVRTAVTTHAFNYLTCGDGSKMKWRPQCLPVGTKSPAGSIKWTRFGRSPECFLPFTRDGLTVAP